MKKYTVHKQLQLLQEKKIQEKKIQEITGKQNTGNYRRKKYRPKKLTADDVVCHLSGALASRRTEVIRSILTRTQNGFDPERVVDTETVANLFPRAIRKGCVEIVRLFIENPRTVVNICEGFDPLWDLLRPRPLSCPGYQSRGWSRDSAIAITRLVAFDPRNSQEHLQSALFQSARCNCLPIAKIILQREKSRINADRTRLEVLRRQSAAGQSVPDEVMIVYILPCFGGQTIVTQNVFDEIARSSYGEFQDHSHHPSSSIHGPLHRQPMIDLLTTFLREYGNIDDFDIPTVWI